MHNSKIYYLFVESENDPLDSPLVIWFKVVLVLSESTP